MIDKDCQGTVLVISMIQASTPLCWVSVLSFGSRLLRFGSRVEGLKLSVWGLGPFGDSGFGT